MSQRHEYPLGYSDQEAGRLADQASRVEEFTADVLRRAGIRPGMQVLDIGSGVGDVSLLSARMVGPEGAVLGVDRASSSVETARRRAADLGAVNACFEESELAAFATDRKFDVIVGRFVLSYVPDRAAVLRGLARHLKPGGIVALMEIDMSQIAQVPPSGLFLQARRWALEAFAAAGAVLDMGSELYATFVQAYLPAPQMIAVHPVVGGPDSSGYDELVEALRSLTPVIERNGIASVAEMELDTLAERLRADAAANDRVVFLSRVVGAWTKVP